MNKLRKLLFFGLLVIPALLVFKGILLPETLVSGDAPYLFTQGLKDLQGIPQTWNEWGNALGGVNGALWLYPINFLYGLIGMAASLGNDLSMRLIFFVPAILSAFISCILFARYLRLSNLATLFVSLLYVLNTYFLLLLDGGQVGVALAYGIFPLTLLFIKKLLDKPSTNTFFVALLFFNVHLHTDVRIAAVSMLTALVWKLFEKPKPKSFLIILLLIALTIPLNAYWLYPLTSLGSANLSGGVAGLQLTSLLNSLTLFQPHWPGNEFGVVSPVPWFFLLLPMIWIVGQVLSPNKKTLPLVLTLLTFGFLAKGTTPPLGFLYEGFLGKVPFASLFRDSTKFFPPLILITGILIGETAECFSKNKNKLVSKIVPVGIYVYLLFLIFPAFTGGLSGALSSKPLEKDYQIVADNVSSQSAEFRTAWFESQPPFAYFSNRQPALDGRYLVNKKPIASINVGSFDSFNFLNSPLSDEWLELFNIKYLMLKPDEKLKKDEWGTLVNSVEQNKEIKKADWGTSLGVYELTNTKPRVFETPQAVLVVGSENIYEKLLEKNPDYDMANFAYFFAEDGVFDPYSLKDLNPSHMLLILNSKDKLDFQMSFLQKFFHSPNDVEESEWAKRNSSEFLKWKYEFLVNGIETKEFDYKKGVSFSTVAGEKIKIDLPAEGESYYLAIRELDELGTTPLKLTAPSGLNMANDDDRSSGNFEWRVFGKLAPTKNDFIIAENPGGFHAINAIAFIPESAWNESFRLLDEYLKKYRVITLDELAAEEQKWEKVDFTLNEPSTLKVRGVKSGWLVFSSTYDENWQGSLPAYSSLNSWYIHQTGDLVIEYKGQKLLRDGLKVSLITLVLLLIGFLALKFNKR